MRKRWAAFLAGPYGIAFVVIFGILALVGYLTTVAQLYGLGLPAPVWALILSLLFVILTYLVLRAYTQRVAALRRDLRRVRIRSRERRETDATRMKELRKELDQAKADRDRAERQLAFRDSTPRPITEVQDQTPALPPVRPHESPTALPAPKATPKRRRRASQPDAASPADADAGEGVSS